MNDRTKFYAGELLIRLSLGYLFWTLQHKEPFRRKIHPEELWLYKNPRAISYFPGEILWIFIWVVPLAVIVITNTRNKSKTDILQSFLAVSLSLGLNGAVTNTIKLIVGRPRPDYFYRCFPDGKGDLQLPCSGEYKEIIEGLKSFPSGHASFSFCSTVFCSLYLCGKLNVFNSKGRGSSWRLMVALSPLVLALMISLSRTCDYHHHWQDVLVGSIIGTVIAYLCYFQYYPSLNHSSSSLPNCMLMTLPSSECNSPNLKKKSDSMECISVKWI